MQAATGTPVDMVQVLEAVVVLMIAAPPLIRTIFRLRGGGGVLQVLARGWGHDGLRAEPHRALHRRRAGRHRPALAGPRDACCSGSSTFFVLGHFAHAGDATFAFSQPFAKVTVPNLTLPAE